MFLGNKYALFRSGDNPFHPFGFFIFYFCFKYPPYSQTLLALICGTFFAFGGNYQSVTFPFIVGLYFS